MKMYMVKVTAKATESNVNFKGTEGVVYYGKGNEVIAYVGSYYEAQDNVKPLYEWWVGVEEYAYERKCDAKRNWWFKNIDDVNETFTSWYHTVELVEIDVAEIDEIET